MTDPRTFRRRAAALALIPATAGVFGASLAWAGANDPLATASSSSIQPAPATQTPDPRPTPDEHIADLTAQVVSAQARIAALRAVLAARAADTAAARVQAEAAAAAVPAARAPARAPARAAAPPVHVVTKASG